MNHRQRIGWTLAGTALTLAWLAAGTSWFAWWQAGEKDGPTAGQIWRGSAEAALLVALLFWVLAGIACGAIRWIVTGRGPQA